VLGTTKAQFLEPFNDMNHWIGQKTKFEIVSGQLHLNDPSSASPAYLVRPSQVALNATWEFWAKMNFAPSSTNKLEVVLMSTSENISADYEGYYLSIGENGSLDALELYKKTGASNSRLGRGIEGRFANQLDSFRVKVTRNSNYEWTVYSTIGQGYVEEFRVVDSTFLKSNFFGFKPVYTTTRNNAFYFDKLEIKGEKYIDSIAPKVLAVVWLNSNSLKITFDELMNTSPNLASVSLNNQTPKTSKWEGNSLVVDFENIPSNQYLTLKLSAFQDKFGNSMLDYETQTFFHPIQVNDLVISELLFNPVTGGNDFVEVFNNTIFPLKTDSLFFVTYDDFGKELSRKSLSKNTLLLPNTYFVFTKSKLWLENQYHVKFPNQVIEMDLPSLNDDKGRLSIVYGKTKWIDAMNYTEKYHASYSLDREGKSLERINLQASGLNSSNWFTAAQSTGFASPTFENSAQYSEGDNSFSLFNDRISPDGDGFEDFTLLHYKDIAAGTLMSISIFNKNGVLMDKPFNNFSISGDGFVQLRGSRGGDLILAPGIYIVMIETFDLAGNTFQKRMTLTVNGRF
jgi:hypothetical protein